MIQTTHPCLEQIVAAARAIPGPVLEQFCAALEGLPEHATPEARLAIASHFIQPTARQMLTGLVSVWNAQGMALSPACLAWALRGASAVDDDWRKGFSLELVWTGPIPAGSTLRRTDQALLDLIRQARRSLILVTFTAYNIPAIKEALAKALTRGIHLTLVLESAEYSDGKIQHECMGAFGPQIINQAHVYVWPLAQRHHDAQGRYGSLHVKCAVADDTHAVLSSANLTGHALNLNMEMGVVIRGSDLPSRISEHIYNLIAQQVLQVLPR